MFLVDGYNAIRRTPRLNLAEQNGGLAAGRRALVMAIVASGLLRNERVIVVFDGGAPAGPPEPSPHRMLAIRYSSHPESADDAILSLLASAREKGSLDGVTVVTADRDLSFQTTSLGAAVVSPEAFSGLASPIRIKPRPTPGGSSEKPAPSAADVRYWLEVFGSSEERH